MQTVLGSSSLLPQFPLESFSFLILPYPLLTVEVCLVRFYLRVCLPRAWSSPGTDRAGQGCLYAGPSSLRPLTFQTIGIVFSIAARVLNVRKASPKFNTLPDFYPSFSEAFFSPFLGEYCLSYRKSVRIIFNPFLVCSSESLSSFFQF